MSPTRLPSRARAGARFPFVAALLLPALPLLPLLGAQQQIERADFAQAEKYSPQFLRQFTYSTSVTPQWIGDSDRFWYQYRTSAGTRFWLVDCEARTRVPLFDHDELAALLSEACRKALDATNLELRNAAVDAAGKKLTFVAEGQRFQFDFETRALAAQGRAPAPPSPPAPGAVADGTGREGSQRGGGAPPAQRGGAAPRADHRVFSPDRRHYVFAKGFDLYLASGTEVVAQAGPAAVPAEPTDPAVASQLDGKTAAAALSTQTTEDGTGNGTGNGNGNAAVAVAAQAAAAKPAAAPATAAPRFTYDEAAAVRLTTDGEERYTFAAGAPRPAGRQEQQEREQQQDQNEQDQQQQEERQDSQRQDSQRQLGQREDGGRTGARTADRSATAQPLPASERTSRPSATWSKDSVAFHATRRDSRGVGELFLVDSLAQPRPSLQQYDYPMPGEDAVRKTELWYGAPSAAAPLQRLAPKWKDESYTDVHFLEDGHELRFLRRDRLVRNAELCALDPLTGKVRVLIAEQTADANLITQPVRYVKGKGRMIWWSERSGWGHYYLYDLDGKLLNPITKGAFRASAIVDVDEDKGILWFRGNAREPGENVYYEHLYKVHLDGSGLLLLDPGDATHRSTLSKSRRFVVDNHSRVDLPPRAVLRSGTTGEELMLLAETDMTALNEVGFKLPERFVVKAADGVTDLYGNMWKPFDFDERRKYPIIAHVYPGPQQEGVTHTFAVSSDRQQLAQLGFVVIQVGHRGGTPARSKAYGRFGYSNMRDYALEDKKSAIEQLALRLPFIDITRVGIYGHSGGGFLSAAAMLKPPYNEFFKVAVASAGNHDNNVYNNSWSERYHGLREVEAAQQTGADTARRGRRGGQGSQGTQGEQSGQGTQADRSESGATTGGAAQDPPGSTRFEIRVPTNAELAGNLKGRLLLVHGELDNNVHPAGTMRLVDALIKANKRFDLLIIPGARHSFGPAQGYFTVRMWEYFAQHLLGDQRVGADMKVPAAPAAAPVRPAQGQ